MPSRDHRRHPGGQEGARRPDRWRARERAVLEGVAARPQAARAVHRTRACRRRRRTQAINALRGHLTEFGVIAAKGPVHTSKLIAAIEDPASDLPQAARGILAILVE